MIGLRFEDIVQIIREQFPPLKLNVLHKWFDRLIDEGFIVPTYMNVSQSAGEEMWYRVFRVGEGAIEKAIHLLLLLFEKLSDAIGTDKIPIELFEKFCVLAIYTVERHQNLAIFRNEFDELHKKFYLYGARLSIGFGQREEFLIDWALNSQKIFIDQKEDGKKYLKLFPNIRNVYPEKESPWSSSLYEDVEWAIEDLAKLVKLFHEQMDCAIKH